jgi:glucose/arabinose dehydrogenase
MRPASTMARLLTILALAVTMTAACSDTPPASSASPAGGGETVTGTERIGWTQPAASASDLAVYRFAVYVNGVRRLLENAACATTGNAAGFGCQAPLPALGPGTHTLELAAFFLAEGGAVVEGARSAPLRVTVRASTTPAASAWPDRLLTADSLPLDVTVLAADLSDPVDLAVTGEGAVLVAERAGGIRLFTGRAAEDAAGHVVEMARRDGDAELLSLAVPSDFEETGRLYLALGVARETDGDVHIVRGRLVRGTIGELATVSTHRVPAGANAVLRIGPDRLLYVGIGTGDDPAAAQRLSEAGGKILRLRDDGTLPDDNPWNSAVWSVGHRDPRDLVWQDGTLWQIETDDEGDEINAIRRGANYGWPLVRGAETHPHVTRPRVMLPSGTRPSGLAAVPLASSPLANSLIVAARGRQGLLRVRLDTGPRQQATSWLVREEFGEIAQVAAGPDGALYVITANTASWGAGRDLLIRFSPASLERRPPVP